MFDVDGDRTEDPSQVVTIVAEMPDGHWLAAECDAAEITEQAP